MISRLVRIELESYIHDLIVWGGTVFLVIVLFLSFVGTVVVTRPEHPSSNNQSGLFLFLLSVALSSVALAVKVCQRNSIEKRTRLFSQLPVSTREVSYASWCVRLLWLSITTLAFTVFLARAAYMPFATFALVTLATYLGGTTLVAAISVAMSIRWAKGVYIAGGFVAFLIWFIGNRLMLPGATGSPVAGIGLPGLTGCLVVSSVGLIILDVWLRDRVDDYLG
jgi:hypothetical protein